MPISDREYFDLKFRHQESLMDERFKDLEIRQSDHHQATQKAVLDLAQQVKDILDLERRVDALETQMQTNPSLIWLIRFRTRETMFWILVLFFVLSMLFISDFRHPIMQLLGLPIYTP